MARRNIWRAPMEVPPEADFHLTKEAAEILDRELTPEEFEELSHQGGTPQMIKNLIAGTATPLQQLHAVMLIQDATSYMTVQSAREEFEEGKDPVAVLQAVAEALGFKGGVVDPREFMKDQDNPRNWSSGWVIPRKKRESA